MASIINASINLTAIDKSKIIDGKKGKYLPITIVLNDEIDQFGNQGNITIAQSKEERDAKAKKTYFNSGSFKIVWTNGSNVDAAPRDSDGQGGSQQSSSNTAKVEDDDLPF